MKPSMLTRIQAAVPLRPAQWALLAAFICAADLFHWEYSEAGRRGLDLNALSVENLDRWTAACERLGNRGTACHVALSFSYTTMPGERQFGIIGLSGNYVSLTAPMRPQTFASWRVDGQAPLRVLSTNGSGALLSSQSSVLLVEEMLAGTQVTVSFTASDTGKVIERSFPLGGFAQAYARYRRMQHSVAMAQNV